MKKILMSLVTVSAVALLGSGCVSLEEYDRVQKHLDTEKEANRALSAENSRLEGEVVDLRGDKRSLEQAIAELKEVNSQTPEMDKDALLKEIRKVWGGDMNSNEWEMVQSGGAVGVRMDDSGVLFGSGSWTLTSQTKERLTKLAGMIEPKLKADANIFVRVDGHTDSDPIKKLKAKGIQDNVHLSAMRAMAVRDFLVSAGVPKDRIFVAGFGEHWPINSGNSSRAKMRNRRVEVYLGDPDALSIGQLPDAQVSK